MTDLNTSYKHNIKFWEDAWQRVKHPYRKLADLDYLTEIPEVFKQYNSKTILDIACGSGWLSFYLASFGFKAVGVDISVSAIDLANRWIVEDSKNEPDGSFLRSQPRVQNESVSNDQASCATTNTDKEVKATAEAKFYVADMMNLDPLSKEFPAEGFDGLLVNAAFEHLDYARGREFLEHVTNYMKPGGIMFAIFDKVGDGGKGEYIELEDGTKQYTDKFRDGMFLRYYSDDELKDLLAKSGWQILNWRENALGSRIVVAKAQRSNSLAPKESTTKLINLHTLISIGAAALIYFINSKTLGQGVLVISAVLNLYLRMLCFGFAAQLQPQNNPIIIMLLSGLRAALAAGLLYLAISRLKISIVALLLAILIYLLVLLISGLMPKR